MSLKIKDLYLENFAKIYTGMQLDKLYLDFDNMPNRMYLFVGDSGSGKSSILKCIHPFAFNSGAGDETSNSDLIMNGRNGKKVIQYELGNTLITCTHLYLRKSDQSIQVKSFFAINGEEQNQSGLVSTYKELVLEYFKIDESFLSLLSLGNTVKGMVEYTSGERKKFAVKIFTQLNVYMNYYKNATSFVKDLKSVLNNVVSKLERYSSIDPKDIKEELEQLSDLVQKEEIERNTLLKEEGGIQIELDRNKDGYQTYESSQGEVTNLLEQIERLKVKRKSNKDYTVLENDKHLLQESLITTELRINSLESTIKSELDFKEMKLTSKKNLEDSIHRMKENIDKVELEKLKANIEAELSNLLEIELLDGVDYNTEKENWVKADIYLNELRGMCTDLITEIKDTDIIPDVLKGFLKNKNFERELDNHVNAMVEKVETLQSSHQLIGDIKIPRITSDCKKDCPYKRFYETCYEYIHAKVSERTKIVAKEQHAKNLAEQKWITLKILKKLYNYVNTHKEFNCLTKEIFDPETFVIKYITGMDRLVHDVIKMSDVISYLEQCVQKQKLEVMLIDVNKQIQGLDNTISLYHSMEVDLEKANLALEETDTLVSTHQKDLEFNKNKLEEYNNLIMEIDKELDVVSNLEFLRNSLKELQSKIHNMENCKQVYESLSGKMVSLKRKEMDLTDRLKEHRNRINELNHIIDTMISLEQEKKTLMEKYTMAVEIKDAVSPSKGIPIEFIDDVIRNQMIDSVNELIQIAYPDITLVKDVGKLIIDEKEFTIPYKKNGVIIGDISEASDGERSMMTVAFALVLIRLTSEVYNIMCLDEMDSALDKHGSSKFLNIIEHYMDIIHANQIFLISHKTMSDMYPVNVLRTTPDVENVRTNQHIVNVFEGNI